MTDQGFWSRAAGHPDRVALIDDKGSPTSYGQLAEEQNQAANGLLELGLRPGDTVAVLLRNQPEFLELALACLQIGLYFLPLNTHLGAVEVAHILEDSGARVLIADQRLS